MALALKRNAVSVQGEGTPVVLVHGFGCDQTMWRPMESHLKDCKIVRYDLTGMGESDYSAYDERRHGSLAGHADDLIEVLDAADVGPAVLVGHSVSAMIVALASIKRPDLVKGLVMIGPNPRYVNDPPYEGGFSQEDIDGLLETVEQNYTGWAGQLAGLVGGPDAPEAVGLLDARFCKNDPIISRHFARTTFLADNRDDLPKITAPTLIVQASEDAIAPLGVGEYVNAHIPGSRLAMVACRGHAPHMTRPGQTADAIDRFVRYLP